VKEHYVSKRENLMTKAEKAILLQIVENISVLHAELLVLSARVDIGPLHSQTAKKTSRSVVKTHYDGLRKQIKELA
jgi:hypothetical protein